MKYETKFRLLISYLVASQVIAQQPVQAYDPNSGTINSYLAALAAKNGVMYVNAAAPSHTSGGSTPTTAQLVSAVRNLPKAVSYPNGMPTPDPTAEEALTLIGPVTDVQPVVVDGKTVYPIFGTVTQADETLTGLFEDLSNVDTSADAPDVDPNWFDPNTDADGNPLTPTAYDIVEPVLNDQEKAVGMTTTVGVTTSIGLLEKKIQLDPTGVLEFASARGGVGAPAGGAEGDDSVAAAGVSLPELPLPEDEIGDTIPSLSQVASAGNVEVVRDTAGGIMLRGVVEANVDGSNFVHVDHANAEKLLASGHTLSAHKGSMLWLEQDDEGRLSVKSASHGVRVALKHGLNVDLKPGEELVWARNPQEAAACLKDGVSRRNISRHMLPDGSCVIVSEFSLLHHLSKQSDDLAVRPYREQMLKTIAALNVACRHHGRYRLASAG
jgi:hypothetical protein